MNTEKKNELQNLSTKVTFPHKISVVFLPNVTVKRHENGHKF